MRDRFIVLVIVSMLGCRSAAPPPAPPPDPNEQALSRVRSMIAGRENESAETVFKNIRILRGMPAARVPRIMQTAFSRSLGVTCDHCHDPAAFDADVKPAKQTARDMWAMMGKINRELLAPMPTLGDRKPTVNCTTCHRGEVKPALDLATSEPRH